MEKVMKIRFKGF